MSIVCYLPAGWMLDHLSFINKTGYYFCHSLEHSAHDSFDNTVLPASSGTILLPIKSCTKSFVPDFRHEGEKNGQMVKRTYIFREEYFNVLKPHITESFQMERHDGTNLETGESGQQKSAKDKPVITIKAKKKRKRSNELNHGESDILEYHLKISGIILDGTRSLIQEARRSGFLQPSSLEQFYTKTSDRGQNNFSLAELCEMAKCFVPVNEREQKCVIDKETSDPEQVQLTCVTENNTNNAKMLTLMGQKYLFPPKSAFLLSDISCMQPLLNYKKKYDIIVIDPPWENKSVKRSSRYGFLSHWQIKEIPVPALAAPDCLVVTWVTNRQKHLRFVKNELYPHWSIHDVVEWFWVKITKSGEFVIPLDSLHKKPYEILVLGRVQGNTDVPLRLSEDEKFPAIPDQKLIVSVPCTLHSHKPPLSEILKEYTKPDVECLELFARNLQPGWTSWGNEVLKFQDLDYFTALQNND
ncbi:methyltransferase-like protein 4 isoform X1 [Python bivittatus]|uniref:Methyltransferase-like protein 4 isoform X1 n=2 Tax=Python bivittatus TaxID=176946 RepID=A0A9F5N2B2_PYTBI|nr:methyltransferase-like protein 4 isoform X1 [Python bivittatus]XP_025025418.1 methyltransferase-like protein 4 isoform X1 [Python bivittatus]